MDESFVPIKDNEEKTQTTQSVNNQDTPVEQPQQAVQPEQPLQSYESNQTPPKITPPPHYNQNNQRALSPNLIYDPANNVYYSVGGSNQSSVKASPLPIIATIVAIATIVTLFFSAISGLSSIENAVRYGGLGDFFIPHAGPYDDSDDYLNYDNYSNAFYDPGGISSSELEEITLGMTYAHISAIIGGDGVIAAGNTDLRGNDYIVYAWTSETDINTIVYITITLDVVSDITVDGVVE